MTEPTRWNAAASEADRQRALAHVAVSLGSGTTLVAVALPPETERIVAFARVAANILRAAMAEWRDWGEPLDWPMLNPVVVAAALALLDGTAADGGRGTE